MCPTRMKANVTNKKGDKAFRTDDRSHQSLGRISGASIGGKQTMVNLELSPVSAKATTVKNDHPGYSFERAQWALVTGVGPLKLLF